VLLQKIDDVIDVLAPVGGRLLGETESARCDCSQSCRKGYDARCRAYGTLPSTP
jgi:hypothetical protein